MSEQSPEKKRDFLPIIIVGVILAALCGISLYIRMALPHDQVFVNGAVWFRETDAYYYMRNIENLVHNFPHFNSFDPYALYPGGGMGLTRPFFGWLVAGIILLVKGAASSLHSMEVVAAYMPAVLGTLTLIPVYFIGKELFNRWVGVIGAALVVILPTEFMHRSLLGFTDHHVAETLFSTVSVLFLIMAIKRAREREISFSHVLSGDWPTIGKPLLYSLLAGVFLGIYLLSWQGGLMFVFIIFLYLVIQFVVDHLRRKSTDYLCVIGTPLFLMAFLMLLFLLISSSLDTMSVVSLLIAIVVPIVLSIVSRLMASRSLKPAYYPLVLLGLTGVGLAALRAINPSLLGSMFGQFGIFTPSGAALTIMEMTPILAPYGTFTLSMAWGNFTTSFFIAFIALVMLVFVVVRERSADKSLFLVWSVVMLLAILGQRRFGYYYAVNAALLTGYFSWKMLDIAGLAKLLAKPKEVVEAVKKFKKKKKKVKETAKPKTFMRPRGVWVRIIVVGIVLFFLVFFPNIGGAEGMAKSQSDIHKNLADGWYTSSLWLGDNTPGPFGDPDLYYEIYTPKNEFEYPDTAYGVMSWWDYGYFIMQIAHRVPNSNPGQAGAVQAGQFFTAQNETSANMLADELGTKYVMIDSDMATGKFYAMAEFAGKNVSDFQEYYGVPPAVTGGDPQALYLLYNPAYYRSTVVRLYNFNGQPAATSENCTLVIPWSGESVYWTGISEILYRNIIGEPKYFSSYEDARAYVAAQTSGNYGIVGYNRFATIVPLEKLNSYELVYPLEDTASSTTVKIFKYLGSDEP